MPKGNSGRHKNSMAGRQTRDITIKDVDNFGFDDEGRISPEDNKIIKVIQNAPVGTEITLKGTNDNYSWVKNPGDYEEKYRITGTLRNKIIEPLGTYERYNDELNFFGMDTKVPLKKMSLTPTSISKILGGSLDHSFDVPELKIHMKKTPKTNAERKAQNEESAIERRQLKLFR